MEPIKEEKDIAFREHSDSVFLNTFSSMLPKKIYWNIVF